MFLFSVIVLFSLRQYLDLHSDFPLGIFSGEGKIYCYANFSIVFGPTFRGGGGGQTAWKKASFLFVHPLKQLDSETLYLQTDFYDVQFRISLSEIYFY